MAIRHQNRVCWNVQNWPRQSFDLGIQARANLAKFSFKATNLEPNSILRQRELVLVLRSGKENIYPATHLR
jgi:hypothetical protein